MTKRVLIIGGGHAAGQCAASLRQNGWDGEIVIAGEEPHPPYQRPPLSKAYLAGALEAERLFFKPLAFYEKHNVTLETVKRAVKINRSEKIVDFQDGAAINYDYLVIATGARVRRLDCPGAALEGVGYLRSIADVDLLKTHMREGAALAIVGAGYIGLEVAAVAARRGVKVTVLEIADRVLARVTGPTVSSFFEKLHRGNGVDLRLGARLESFEGAGRVRGARLSDGSVAPCDAAIIGVGVLPNDDLAAGAGLETNDGVVVDEFARTEDEAIFAIGDCTRHPSRYYGAMLRLESVHNALEQAKTAAAAICGAAVPYDQAPWFWSDQYEVKLQTVGVCSGRYDEEIIRGRIEDKQFSVFYLKGDRLIAADSINAPADHMIARKVIAAGRPVRAKEIADSDFDLKTYLRG